MSTKSWLLLHEETNSVHPLQKSPTVLGRARECDIVYQDPSISSRHVQFNVDGKILEIHDLNSENGTFFNGKRFKSVKLKTSRVQRVPLTIGGVAFSLAYGTVPADMSTPSPSTETDGEPAEWFFVAGGVEYGPLTLRQLFAAVDRGELRPTDDLWQEGMRNKVKAFEVEGLFDGNDRQSNVRDGNGAAASTAGHVCPYCWNRFRPEDVLFIAGHAELMGDPVVGPDEYQRFLPTRFTPEGLAIDAGNVICPDMACPVCHLRLPTAIMNTHPLFMSVVGATSSGKSYFLASASWNLRTTLPRVFGIRFMDVDASSNQWLNDYEEKLFFQVDEKGFQSILKTTQTAPAVYRSVMLNNMPVWLPLPVMFAIHIDDTTRVDSSLPHNRTLVLYDNAGEHYQAGQDTAQTPGTKHLVHAEGILFLFDPTEDPRFRPVLAPSSAIAQSSRSIHRQDVILIEMIGRIRKHLGMRSDERLHKTVIMGISKADLLANHLPALETDPWRSAQDGSGGVLDMTAIDEMSSAVRRLLLTYAPEIVPTVESFSESVLYLPNSALGHQPSVEGVRPCDIRPRWVEVPLLCVLARLGYIRTTRD